MAMSYSARKQCELARERETFRYDPALIAKSIPNSPARLVPSHRLATSPDTILTTFCQLAALRLNTSRALISLFDRSSQFVIAEATPHVRLLPNYSPKHTDQGLWLCGIKVPRSFGVCERVVIASTNPSPYHNSTPRQLPVTVINDLTDDEKLYHRPYCQSWPNNRFYAGVPLITPRGIVIGVLCVFDSQPRSGLDQTSETILRDVAQSVMKHLEERRVSERYRQADRVTRGIRRFFHGRSSTTQIQDDQSLASDPRLRPRGGNFSPQFNYSSHSRPREDGLAGTCASATDIMRDALEVDGLLLLDASNSHRSHPRNDLDETSKHSQRTQPQPDSDDLCPVLGSSITAEAKQNGNSYFGHSTLYASTLKKLLSYYPRGTIWTFDDDAESDASEILSDDSVSGVSSLGHLADETDEDVHLLPPDLENTPEQRRTRRELRKAVMKLLPGATSVAFFPIWNAHKRRWFAGGFAYSNNTSRVFSPKRELSYLRAFGTVLMAEVSFIKEREVELSKLDVLDSISHELRSPLHGIVFGAGFLRGEDLNPSQDDALLSIEACSRTLLDTIDQILDWSKINHFTSSLAKGPDYTFADVDSRAQRSSRNNSVEAGMMSITSDVDLPGLIEEVVESVNAGHEFQKLSFGSTTQTSDIPNDHVKILVHFEPGENWRFHVQPGAIRRIIMNVLGNSLRFTRSGNVYFQVEQSATADASVHLVKLTIADTGCGMSRDFLTNDLFSPFTQQNMMNAGTGLGLSIVRRITQALGGTVEVHSAPDVGTTVRINLPLKLSEKTFENADAADSVLQHGPEGDIDGSRVSLVGFEDLIPGDLDSPLLKSPLSEKENMFSVCQYWLGLHVLEGFDSQNIPRIVLCDNHSVEKARSLTRSNESLPIIVICEDAVMARKKEAAETHRGAVIFTHQPIGPRKLARILSRAVKSHSAKLQFSGNQPILSKEAQGNTLFKKETAPSTPPNDEDEKWDPMGSPFFDHAMPLPSEWHLPKKLPRSPVITLSENTGPIRTEESPNSSRFLLVDDNPINLKMLAMFMKKLNQQYSTATDGQKAVAKYQENPNSYRCVFMDISMPIMNGFEATRAIRAIEADDAVPRCSIFALTGLASKDAQQEASLCGIDLFLTKPLQLAEMKDILVSKGLL